MSCDNDSSCLGDTKPLVVLDKSFVQSASRREVVALCDSNRVIMIEDLLFEMIDGDLETRTQCFRKFPDRVNPVAVLPNVGTLMRHEREFRQPCTPVWNHKLPWRFNFNKRLATGNFELNNQQRQAVGKWESNLVEDVNRFVERGVFADELLPALRGFRPGQNPEKIQELLTRIASDMESVRRFYKELSTVDFPPASIVGRTWAVFRFIQVQLIGVVEFFKKYGAAVHPTNRDKLENEFTDLNYLVVASLAGGLATRDKALASRFSLLCPKGLLIS